MSCAKTTHLAAGAAGPSAGIAPTTSKAAASHGRARLKKAAVGAAVVGTAITGYLVVTQGPKRMGDFTLATAIRQDRQANQLYRQAAGAVAQAMLAGRPQQAGWLAEADRQARRSIQTFEAAGRMARLSGRLKSAPASLIAPSGSDALRTSRSILRAKMLLLHIQRIKRST